MDLSVHLLQLDWFYTSVLFSFCMKVKIIIMSPWWNVFFILGSVVIQGCVCRILSGGVGMPELCSEGLVQGHDVRELQKPALPGGGWLPSRSQDLPLSIFFIFPFVILGSPYLTWVKLKPCLFRHEKSIMWQQGFKLSLSSDDLSPSWYIRGCSKDYVFINPCGKLFKYLICCLLPLCNWLNSFSKNTRYLHFTLVPVHRRRRAAHGFRK